MRNKEADAIKSENNELKKKIEYLSAKLKTEGVKKIPIERICCDTVRREEHINNNSFLRLTESLKKHGQVEPIIVKKILSDENEEKCLYALVSGYLRVKAMKLLGEKYINALLYNEKNNYSVEISYITNDLRQGNTIFEKAEMINSLYTASCKDLQTTAEAISSTKEKVNDYLELLNLSEETRNMCFEYSLSEHQIICIAKINDEMLRNTAIRHIGRAKLNSRETIDYIYDISGLESILTYAEPQKRKLILKDIRLLYNTIDNIVDTVKESGVPVEYNKEETIDGFNINLKIKKVRRQIS